MIDLAVRRGTSFQQVKDVLHKAGLQHESEGATRPSINEEVILLEMAKPMHVFQKAIHNVPVFPRRSR